MMFDITGRWESESVGGNQRYSGELDITQTGNFVTAISTTGNSSWTGNFDGQVLNASYIKDGAPGKVILQISKDGQTMQGSWKDSQGYSGSYVARRKGR